MEEIKQALEQACKKEFGVEVKADLSRPAEEFGDYASNVALQLSKKLGKNPHDIATSLVAALKSPLIAKTDVAGPGFINIWLTDEALADAALSATKLEKPLVGEDIVLEHTDPNPFKDFHIGHAYSNTIGVSIGKLLQASGAKIHQVSYHGDVGFHIAAAVYARKVKNDTIYLSAHYGQGIIIAAENPDAKKEIDEINKKIYDKSDPAINKLYEEGREQSLKEFERIYDLLNSKFEKNYFERDVAPEGEKIVRKNVGKVFEESDGAIIYDGEKEGLHKRVFITKLGLPTYEAKEIGLAFAKSRDYSNSQKFIVVTGNEIDDYFRVLLAAISKIDLPLSKKIVHIGHGMVRSVEGKMSSRTGNVKLFDSLAANVKETIWEKFGKDKVTDEMVYGAIKYEFLKHRIGSSFVFDVDQSVSLEGNSGPYLQYAHARARSILTKSKPGKITDLDISERSLARQISQFPEVVAEATNDLMPSHICGYLYELAQVFNRFYENSRVAGDKREGTRASLVGAYADVLKAGLGLLNIEAPEKV